MAESWFRLQETQDPDTGEYKPDLHGYNLDYTGNKNHPDGSPKWVVKVVGEQSKIDNLANEPNTQRLNNVPTQALNNILGADMSAEELDRGFSINKSED